MKTAEQFFRDKAFPNGIDDTAWELWKVGHSGIAWSGFSISAMEEYADQYKKLLKELLPMAEDGYNGYVKSGSCHQEFLSEDRELLRKVRTVVAITPNEIEK